MVKTILQNVGIVLIYAVPIAFIAFALLATGLPGPPGPSWSQP